MRVAIILVLACASGCTSLCGPRPTRWLNQMNPFSAPGEKVVLRTYLLDQPAGDPYLTSEIWNTALKPLPAERHALLMENGIRVGHLTGNPPYQFLNLSRTSDAVIKPMEYTIATNEAKPLPLNGPLAEAIFQAYVEIGAKPGQFTIKDAETAMNVTAAVENGKVKLTLEPRVQHGSRQVGWKPTTDATGFTWLDQKTQERFPNLKFEVTLAPEEYLIVGPSSVPARTLGGACFMSVSDHAARMRVLVIQASQFANLPVTGKKGPPVIAAQASMPLVRGQRP